MEISPVAYHISLILVILALALWTLVAIIRIRHMIALVRSFRLRQIVSTYGFTRLTVFTREYVMNLLRKRCIYLPHATPRVQTTAHVVLSSLRIRRSNPTIHPAAAAAAAAATASASNVAEPSSSSPPVTSPSSPTGHTMPTSPASLTSPASPTAASNSPDSATPANATKSFAIPQYELVFTISCATPVMVDVLTGVQAVAFNMLIADSKKFIKGRLTQLAKPSSPFRAYPNRHLDHANGPAGANDPDAMDDDAEDDTAEDEDAAADNRNGTAGQASSRHPDGQGVEMMSLQAADGGSATSGGHRNVARSVFRSAARSLSSALSFRARNVQGDDPAHDPFVSGDFFGMVERRLNFLRRHEYLGRLTSVRIEAGKNQTVHIPIPTDMLAEMLALEQEFFPFVVICLPVDAHPRNARVLGGIHAATAPSNANVAALSAAARTAAALFAEESKYQGNEAPTKSNVRQLEPTLEVAPEDASARAFDAPSDSTAAGLARSFVQFASNIASGGTLLPPITPALAEISLMDVPSSVFADLQRVHAEAEPMVAAALAALAAADPAVAAAALGVPLEGGADEELDDDLDDELAAERDQTRAAERLGSAARSPNSTASRRIDAPSAAPSTAPAAAPPAEEHVAVSVDDVHLHTSSDLASSSSAVSPPHRAAAAGAGAEAGAETGAGTGAGAAVEGLDSPAASSDAAAAAVAAPPPVDLNAARPEYIGTLLLETFTQAVRHSRQTVLTPTHELLDVVDLFGVEDDTIECLVCLTEPKDIVLLPCRHVCLCHTCHRTVQRCPVCRGPILSYMKYLKESEYDDELRGKDKKKATAKKLTSAASAAASNAPIANAGAVQAPTQS